MSKNFLFLDLTSWFAIIILLMVGKQLSEFEKVHLAAYNDSELSFCDIAKKFNHHPSSIDVFLKKIWFSAYQPL